MRPRLRQQARGRAREVGPGRARAPVWVKETDQVGPVRAAYRRRAVPSRQRHLLRNFSVRWKPVYTDEGRRRAIEGDVVMEIVVRRDGSVGDVRLTRTLGAGLDQRAIAAVKQWRFSPARRQGTPVDILVEVAVGFALR